MPALRRTASRVLAGALLLLVRAAAPLAAQRPAAPAPSASAAPARATPRGRVVADTLFSPALGARKQFVVYLPPSYDRVPGRRYPVAYYLHGLFGAEWNWVRAGHLDAVADSLAARGGPEMIVVMPDGDDGWYTTWNTLGSDEACRRDTVRREPAASYCVPWTHYDDYVAHDLVARVDSTYRTVADRAHRGIAGLSMGGYGAIALALAYPDVFAAAASHSGVLTPLYAGPFPYARPAHYPPTPDSLRARWGALWTTIPLAFGPDTTGWWARDPGRLAGRLVAHGRAARGRSVRPVRIPALFADVGTDDRLLAQNRAFRDTMAELGVPLAYAEWPGTHDWAYWRAHVGESLAWLGAHIGGPAGADAASGRRAR